MPRKSRRHSKSDSIPSSRGSVSSDSNQQIRRVSWVSNGDDNLIDMNLDHVEDLNDIDADKDLDEGTKSTTFSRGSGSRGSGSRGSGSRGSIRESLFGRKSGKGKDKRRSSRRSSGRSSFSSSSQKMTSFWSDLANENDLWEENDDDDRYNCCELFSAFWQSRWYLMKRNVSVLRKHPHIILLSLLVFIVFAAASMIMIAVLAQSQRDDLENERLEVRRAAEELAAQTGKFFSDQLDRAILPLFSMAQFVQELDIFHQLPNDIGLAGGKDYVGSSEGKKGALPFNPWDPAVKNGPSHRNVTGVCDEPELVERFNQIAETIKENSKMEGVLVNVQLAPQAVVCMLYPQINYEDFDPPMYMDNTGAIGHDLYNDPNRTAIAQATVPSDKVVIAGPLSLVQCFKCAVAVERAFIARLAIEIPDVSVPGLNVTDPDTGKPRVYNKWGFAVVLINWMELLNRSGVYEQFAKEGNEFQLTRTDQKQNTTTKEYYEKVVVLAESPGFGATNSRGKRREIVSVKLDTTNNEWVMHVEVGDYEMIDLDTYPEWETGAYIGAAIVSVLFAAMFLTVLLEKRLNKSVLEQMLPGKSLKLVSRGKTVVEKFDQATVFFSDIVGYTSMSQELRPLAVMKMLNEFYTGLDAIADKNDVYKMETIGDAYMVTGGAPYRCPGPEGAAKVAMFAIEAMVFTKNFKTSDGLTVQIRAGINTGPLVAGVVGVLKPKYTIYGDTVNVASRMESNSLNGRVQVSETTYFQLQQNPEWDFEYEDRGLIPIKGKGEMHTWFVDSFHPAPPNKKIIDENYDDVYLRDIDKVKESPLMEAARQALSEQLVSSSDDEAEDLLRAPPHVDRNDEEEIDPDDSFGDSQFSGEEYFA